MLPFTSELNDNSIFITTDADLLVFNKNPHIPNLEKGEKINWAMTAKSTGKVIGIIGYVNIEPAHFRAEVGYSLSRAWHRQGIMREALPCVLKYGFEHMNLHSVEAIIDADNIASGGLLLTTGFVQEAFFNEDFYYEGKFRNSIHYGMLRKNAEMLGIL